MAKFLVGRKLSQKIEDVCSGKDVCCAVAFWGSGAANHLFGENIGQKFSARIICDLSMGATDPNELVIMGALQSENIKQIKGLHAKVYISDTGVVVASANASGNGIGFNASDAKHVEAGSFSRKGSRLWREAKAWFDGNWEEADTVSDIDVKNARKLWDDRVELGDKKKNSTPKGELSIIEAVRQCPDIFGGVQFVLSNEENDDKKVRSAEDSYQNEYGHAPVGYEYFQGWGMSEKKWPEVFISIHIGPSGGLYAEYFTRGKVYSGADVLFARKADLLCSELINSDCLDPYLIKKPLRPEDDFNKALLEKILKHSCGGIILSASEFARLLKKHETYIA